MCLDCQGGAARDVGRSHGGSGEVDSLISGTDGSGVDADAGGGDVGLEVSIPVARSTGGEGSKVAEGWMGDLGGGEGRRGGGFQGGAIAGGRRWTLYAEEGDGDLVGGAGVGI